MTPLTGLESLIQQAKAFRIDRGDSWSDETWSFFSEVGNGETVNGNSNVYTLN